MCPDKKVCSSANSQRSTTMTTTRIRKCLVMAVTGIIYIEQNEEANGEHWGVESWPSDRGTSGSYIDAAYALETAFDNIYHLDPGIWPMLNYSLPPLPPPRPNQLHQYRSTSGSGHQKLPPKQPSQESQLSYPPFPQHHLQTTLPSLPTRPPHSPRDSSIQRAPRPVAPVTIYDVASPQRLPVLHAQSDNPAQPKCPHPAV